MRSPPQQFQIWRDANRLPVIARSDSSAVAHRAKAEATKQSIARRKGRMDCFVARAPRNDVERHGFAFSRRVAPEVLQIVPPSKRTEGAGKTGCALHPRSRVQCY